MIIYLYEDFLSQKLFFSFENFDCIIVTVLEEFCGDIINVLRVTSVCREYSHACERKKLDDQ